MAPTKEQILEQVLSISNQNPEHIFAWDEMSRMVMRRLRTTSTYVSKVLGELVEDGVVKRLSVGPSGVLYLQEKIPGIHLMYMHLSEYGGPSSGHVSLKYQDRGSYWPGNGARYYVIGQESWKKLFDKLHQEAVSKRAKEKEKGAIRRSMEEAYLEEKIPDYKVVRDALSALFPGVELSFSPILRDKEKDPRIIMRMDTIHLSELTRLVDLAKRGLEASQA